MAGIWNFEIEQGATFERWIAWEPDGDLVDTAGYTARMHIRHPVTAGTTVIELTNANGRIILGTGTDTAALLPDYKPLNAFYDLELSGGGVVHRVLEGRALIKPEVTR